MLFLKYIGLAGILQK